MGRELQLFMARQSLASLTPPRPDCPVIHPSLLDGLPAPDGDRRWLAAELAKTGIESVANSKPHVLMVDLLDERFDLLQIDSGLVFNESQDFLQVGLRDQPALAGARRIPRLSNEAWELWTAGLERFRLAISASPLANCTMILHRAYWASSLRTGEGAQPIPDEIEILPGHVVSIAAHNTLLDRCYDAFLAAFPQAMVVQAPPETLVADPEHHWGQSPYHYVPDYYRSIAAQLKAFGLG